MESFNILIVTLVVLSETVSTSNSEGIRNEEGFSHPMLHYFDKEEGKSLHRHRRQTDKSEHDSAAVDKPKPPQNPLEHLILNQSKHGQESGASLSRVKRQYSDSESNSIESGEVVEDTGDSYEDNDYEGYPYPYPVPIIIGGFGGGYGGGFGGPGFGGRGFGGRGFGGGFGGRGFGGRGGGFGGRGGGSGGGFGGGRGGGGGGGRG